MKNIEDITAKLEKGVKEVFTSDRFREYLDTMSKFYRYSAANSLLIMLQFPDASLIAGFKAWETKFDRHVKKGEKAIRILAPCPHKKTIQDNDGTEKEITWTTFRPVSVFDVSQTEGKEIPTICDRLQGTVTGYKELIEKLETVSPVPVVYETIEANGYYHTIDKVIKINTGMSELQTVKTLVHEISHSILHDKETGCCSKVPRDIKELQAESVAYTVCQYLGLDTSEYSFEYVAGWSRDKDTKELTNNLEIIRQTAKQIIESIAA